MKTTPLNSEALLDKLLETGQTQKAINALFDLAISSARSKDFIKAQAYRQKICELDSMSLSKIIKINETIEIEKNKAFTPAFRQLWAPFFKILSPEEANAFFFTLKEYSFAKHQVILVQGQPNDCLYLVRSGRLKVIYSGAQNEEHLIHTIGRGDYFGHETFFSMNVCTVSIQTLSETSLGFIDRAHMENLSKELPSLVSHLEKICSSGLSIADRLRQKGMNRRAFKRFKFHAHVSYQLQPIGNDPSTHRPLKGELWDMSKGGFSFYIQSKSRKTAQQMLGQRMVARIEMIDRGKPRRIKVTGIVQGIVSHPMDEYSVHVKMNRNFSDSAIKTLHDIATQ